MPARFDQLRFRFFAAQIDHGLDAQLGQGGETLLVRLRAAIDMFVHLVKIVDAARERRE